MNCTCKNFELRMKAEAKAHNLREANGKLEAELAQVRHRLARAGVERAGEDVEAGAGAEADARRDVSGAEGTGVQP